MMGFVYKDILVLRKTLGFYVVFMLVYLLMVMTGIFEAFVLGGFGVVMGLMLPMSALAMDDQVRWEAYAVATPGGRKSMVAGKYLLSLLVVVMGAVLSLALMLLSVALGRSEMDGGTALVTVLCCGAVGLLMNCVILPIIFKFGVEKSRIIYLTVFAVVFGTIFLGSSLLEDSPPPMPPTWLLNALPVVAVLVVLILLCLSFVLSLHICERKEY